MVLHLLVILLVAIRVLTSAPTGRASPPCELLSHYEIVIEGYEDDSPVSLSLNIGILAVETNQTVSPYDIESQTLLHRRINTLPRHILANRTLIRIASTKVIRVLFYEEEKWLFQYSIGLQNEGESFSMSGDGSRLLVGLRLFSLNDQTPYELGIIEYSDTIMNPVVSTLSPSGNTMAVLLSPKTIGVFEFDEVNHTTSQLSTVEVRNTPNNIYLSADATFLLAQLDRDVLIFEHEISSNAWIQVQVLYDTFEVSLSLDARIIVGRQTNGYIVYRKTVLSSWRVVWQDSSTTVDAVVVSNSGTDLAVATHGMVKVYHLSECWWETSSPTISPAPSKAPSRPPSRLKSITTASVCGIVIEWKEPQPVLWNYEEIQRWESFTASWFERFFTPEFVDLHAYAVTNMRSRVTLLQQTADNVTYDQTMSYDLWNENVTAEEIVLLPSETRLWKRKYYKDLAVAIPMPESLPDEPLLLTHNRTCHPSNSLAPDETTNAPSPTGLSPIVAFRSEDDSGSSLMVYVSSAVGGVVVLILGMFLALCCCRDERGKLFPQNSSCRVNDLSIHTVSAIPVPVEILGDPTVIPHVLPHFKDQAQSIPLAETAPAEDIAPIG